MCVLHGSALLVPLLQPCVVYILCQHIYTSSGLLVGHLVLGGPHVEGFETSRWHDGASQTLAKQQCETHTYNLQSGISSQTH